MADPPSFPSRSGVGCPSRVKLPRDLSGDEVCRALKRLGFAYVRQTGSHRHYVKGSLHPCVPMRRDIKPKTLQSILKQAEITVEELLENL